MGQSDRALRRLVAQLSTAGADDIRLVLEELEPAQARRVSALLGQLADEHDVALPNLPAADRPVASLDGASPWLAARLERSAGTAPRVVERSHTPSFDEGHFRITSVALAALQDCARKLEPRYGLAPHMSQATPLDRLGDLFLRKGMAR